MTFEMALVRVIRAFLQSVGYKYPRVKKLSSKSVEEVRFNYWHARKNALWHAVAV